MSDNTTSHVPLHIAVTEIAMNIRDNMSRLNANADALGKSDQLRQEGAMETLADLEIELLRVLVAYPRNPQPVTETSSPSPRQYEGIPDLPPPPMDITECHTDECDKAPE